MPRKSAKTSIWFDYEIFNPESSTWEPDPDRARVEVQNLTDDELAEISRISHATKTVFDPAQMKPVREDIFDPILDRQETAVRAVKSLENFFDEDGELQECTAEVLRSWACNSNFMMFLNKVRPIVEAEARERAEKKRKNS